MVNFDKVEFTKEGEKFLDNLETKTRNKVYYKIRKSQHVIDENLFKKLDGEIWEFRTLYKKEKIRLFAFRLRKDNVETIVITTHGIIKKTSGIPKKEITKANKIRTQYLNSIK